ncbi:DUF1189 domain-containing protein [Patescibacteria group bacterium]|nr:DUF1189 domain-containing protein [Patescibacteria group bacterium]
MKKLQTFFYVFKNSITSHKYYNDILKTNFWFSVKYFMMLSFFASLVFTIFTSVVIIPGMVSGIRSVSQSVKEVFPEDLVVIFKDGGWETNKEGPVVIPMISIDEQPQEYLPENIIVFDKEGTIDKLEEYNTLALLNNENIIYRNEGNSITSQPISNIPDFTLDKSTVDGGIDNLYKYLRILPYVLPLFILLFTFLFNYIGGAFFSVLLIGLVLYVISLISKTKIPFVSAIKISIHAMTVPIILQLILIPFPEINSYIPGWFFISTLIISLYFMFKMEDTADLKKIDK